MSFLIRSSVSVLFLLSLFSFSPAQAITCTPTCAEGYTCELYEGKATCLQNDCIKDNSCSVSEVTATADSNRSFARLVYGVIVPFVNNSIVPLIYALTFLVFMVGMVQFFFLDQSEEGRAKGKNLMLWGVIAFFVMFSVWGLVNLLVSSFAGAVGGSGA